MSTKVTAKKAGKAARRTTRSKSGSDAQFVEWIRTGWQFGPGERTVVLEKVEITMPLEYWMSVAEIAAHKKVPIETVIGWTVDGDEITELLNECRSPAMSQAEKEKES